MIDIYFIGKILFIILLWIGIGICFLFFVNTKNILSKLTASQAIFNLYKKNFACEVSPYLNNLSRKNMIFQSLLGLKNNSTSGFLPGISETFKNTYLNLNLMDKVFLGLFFAKGIKKILRLR